MFKKRTAENEDKIMRQFCDSGPDTEDVEMLKQALKRLKEKKDELADGVRWAYYPSDILFTTYVAIPDVIWLSRLFYAAPPFIF